MIVRFWLMGGTMVEWNVRTKDFSLPQLVRSIYSTGYFLQDDLYIPIDKIACIGLGDSSASVMVPPTATQQ